MVCAVGVYDQRTDRLIQREVKLNGQVTAFIAALRRTGHVLAHDASTHPATRDFHATVLRPFDVRSVMAAALGTSGRVFGALTCAHTGVERRLAPRQLGALTSLGSRMTLAMSNELGVATWNRRLQDLSRSP